MSLEQKSKTWHFKDLALITFDIFTDSAYQPTYKTSYTILEKSMGKYTACFYTGLSIKVICGPALFVFFFLVIYTLLITKFNTIYISIIS